MVELPLSESRLFPRLAGQHVFAMPNGCSPMFITSCGWQHAWEGSGRVEAAVRVDQIRRV